MATRVDKGLYIKNVGGTNYYVVRFMRKGKRIERSLGRCDGIPRSRAKLLAVKIQAAPLEEKKERARIATFGECWQRALEDIAILKQWRNQESRNAWRHAYEDLALPSLKDKRVDEISVHDLVDLLMQYWLDRPETASRLRMRLEAFFAWAKARGMRQDNPAIWRGNLDQFLPARNKVARVKHHEAPTLPELATAIAYCLSHPSPVSGCILFCIATVGRVSEVRLARREEIEGDTWIMPAERRKDGKPHPHRVPLSSLAMKALEMAQPRGYLFTATGAALAVDSPRMKLRMIIGRPVTAHGIRSTFRDWAALTGVPEVLAEKSLSHQWGSEVTEAYLRTDLLDQRRPILEHWAEVLFELVKKQQKPSSSSGSSPSQPLRKGSRHRQTS